MGKAADESSGKLGLQEADACSRVWGIPNATYHNVLL